MAQIIPWKHVPGMLMKDLGARCIMSATKMTSRRDLPPMMRHQNVRIYRGVIPLYTDAAFIAPNAMIQGNVILGHNVSIFYHSYIRNYHLTVSTMLGDNVTVADRSTFMGQVKVGDNTFIGCGVTLDMCEVMNNVYISHGCAIANGAVIEDGAVLALGTVIEADARVKTNEYWAGNPGRFVCHVDKQIRERTDNIATEYRELGKKHAKAIDEHIKSGETLDDKWLKQVVAQMESRQKDVQIPVSRPIPAIAKRFYQPRVHARLPQFHARVSFPMNRQAPWVPQQPDNVGNA